jgi:four helix bundle protein
MTSGIRSYRDLVVWQKSVELSVACYTLIRPFPASERYGLASQVQRAAVSIPANIAEGYGKSGPNQYLSHLSHARGSLRELETLLIIASRVGHGPAESYRILASQADEVGRMLYSLSRKIAASTACGVPDA